MKSAPPTILIALILIVGHLPAQNDLAISGFVDGSIGLPVEDRTDLGFSFDQVEINLDGEVTMAPNLTLGFEFNTGTKSDAGENISGWLVMANHAFSAFAITFRQDAWGDAGSTTISPSHSIADGANIFFEYRLDTGTFDEDDVYHRSKTT